MLKGEMVAILLMTRHPVTQNLVAVLSRRGGFNPETVTNPEKYGCESFPGLCQLTAAGRIENRETPEQALLREIDEELGSDMCRHLSRVASIDKLIETDGRHIMVTEIEWKYLGLLPHGHFVLVDEENVIEIAKTDPDSKRIGFPDMKKIVMFKDEREVVMKALDV